MRHEAWEARVVTGRLLAELRDVVDDARTPTWVVGSIAVAADTALRLARKVERRRRTLHYDFTREAK